MTAERACFRAQCVRDQAAVARKRLDLPTAEAPDVPGGIHRQQNVHGGPLVRAKPVTAFYPAAIM